MVVVGMKPEFGTGIYSFPSAARLIDGATPRQLRYWMATGLTDATFGKALSGGSSVLSFHDVISLEIVRRFRTHGVSLQKVRHLEAYLRDNLVDVARPFATERFYTDGVTVWVQDHPEDEHMVEVAGRHSPSVANATSWAEVVSSFAQEVQYQDGLAVRWDLSEWVEIDPEIQFGDPVVRGTRVPIDTVREALEIADVEQVASWYDLSGEAVRGVQKYLRAA